MVELLSPYGHDPNPVEWAWGNLKSSELADRCRDTINEAGTFADQGLQHPGPDTRPYLSCLRRYGLSP